MGVPLCTFPKTALLTAQVVASSTLLTAHSVWKHLVVDGAVDVKPNLSFAQSSESPQGVVCSTFTRKFQQNDSLVWWMERSWGAFSYKAPFFCYLIPLVVGTKRVTRRS